MSSEIGGRLVLRAIDLECLGALLGLGPTAPGALARHVAVHPATMTGILDRLERGGWVVRERGEEGDRRSIRVHVVPDRAREVLDLLGGVDAQMDDLCAGYTEAELAVVVDFLERAATAVDEGVGNLRADGSGGRHDTATTATSDATARGRKRPPASASPPE